MSMRGAITPLPYTPSWRGAQFKTPQGQIYLYLCPYPEVPERKKGKR
jgi:hypothetical protein